MLCSVVHNRWPFYGRRNYSKAPYPINYFTLPIKMITFDKFGACFERDVHAHACFLCGQVSLSQDRQYVPTASVLSLLASRNVVAWRLANLAPNSVALGHPNAVGTIRG